MLERPGVEPGLADSKTMMTNGESIANDKNLSRDVTRVPKPENSPFFEKN